MIRFVRIGVIAVGSMALATAATLANVSNAATRTNPPLALSVRPSNGVAQDRMVELQLALAMQQQAQAQQAGRTIPLRLEGVEEAARAALQTEPFSISSIVALSLSAQSHNETELADALLDEGARLSRRDSILQMQLAQRAATRNDFAGTVRHLDELLRTKPDSYGTVFPILAANMAAPEMVSLLTPIAKQDPDWYKLFIGEAVSVPAALPAVRELMIAAPEGRAAQDPQLRINLISQLVAARQIDLARSYFELLHPEADGLVVDEEFLHTEYEAPFGWMPNDDPQLTAEFLQGEGIELYAAIDREGDAVQQVTALRTGRYTARLEADAASLASTYVTVRCLDGRRVGATDPNPRGVYTFAIPAGCSNQVLGIAVKDGDDTEPVEAVLQRITLTRAAS